MAKPGSRRTFRFKNASGGINSRGEEGSLLPFGFGLQSKDQELSSVPLQFRDMENFRYLKRGGLTKSPGYTLHKAFGAGVLTGLHRFIRANGDTFLLVTHGSNLYKLVGTTETDIGNVTNNAYTDFSTAYNYAVICDGTAAPQKFDGTTVSALAATAPTGTKQSLFTRDRLFLFGDPANPSLIQYSAAGDITTGYNTNLIQCDVNDGQKITSMRHLFIPGELNPVIFVTKERSAGVVTGDGTASNPFTYFKSDPDSGTAGFRASVQASQDMTYLTPIGVTSYKTSLQDVKLQQSYLTTNVADKFQALNQTTINSAIAYNELINNRIGYAVPENDITYPNVLWYYDTVNQSWYKERWGSNVTAVLSDSDGSFYHGDSSGNLYLHNDSTFNYNGGAIRAFANTDYMDFFEPGMLKRIIDSKITVRGNGTYGLTIATKLNYGVSIGKSYTVDMEAGLYIWGGFEWTDNPDDYQWGVAPIRLKRFYPSGTFYNIQFSFVQSGINTPIDIFDWEITVEYLESR